MLRPVYVCHQQHTVYTKDDGPTRREPVTVHRTGCPVIRYSFSWQKRISIRHNTHGAFSILHAVPFEWVPFFVLFSALYLKLFTTIFTRRVCHNHMSLAKRVFQATSLACVTRSKIKLAKRETIRKGICRRESRSNCHRVDIFSSISSS